MRCRSLAWALVSFACLAQAIPPVRSVPKTHVVHEQHRAVHVTGWTLKGRAESQALLPMRIGLRQSGLDAGHELLMNISSPSSKSYGKHLSAEEVVAFFAPAAETEQAWLQFQATVQEANKLLFADYHVYEHVDTGIRNIATSKYHVPANISQHIDYITPGVKLLSRGYSDDALRRAKKRRDKGSPRVQSDISRIVVPSHFTSQRVSTDSCAYGVTPQCVRDIYNIPLGTRASPGNELGIFQTLGEHYHQDDLDAYWADFAPYIPNGTHPILRAINGAFGPAPDLASAGSEADLDFQVAIPLVWPQSTVLWQTDDEWYEQDQTRDDTQYTGFFNTLFDAMDGSYCGLDIFGQDGNCVDPGCRDPVYPNPADGGYKGQLMCGVYVPTKVLAISYSGLEHALPDRYVRRQCLEVLKLGLQGVTVVESSGDHGVGGQRSDPTAECLGPKRNVFSPRMLSTCPYVLSVGATSLGSGTDDDAQPTEIAPTYFSSGGGFSNVFETPSWQKNHVQKYLWQTNLGSAGYVGGGRNFSITGGVGGLFNKAGRGYPDVAAIGDNYSVYVRGQYMRIGGTSVAAPIWASILTLINEERLARNQSTVGFIHPTLYENPQVFTDVKVGQNPGCGSDGFRATEGWDPVTGLGTPNYPRLLDLFLSLP